MLGTSHTELLSINLGLPLSNAIPDSLIDLDPVVAET